MQDFIYEGGIRILYGAEQLPWVAEEIAKLGRRMLVIPTGSFLSGGHYETLERALTRARLVVFPLNAGRKPLLSKVQEGARLCAEKPGQSHRLRRAEYGCPHGEIPDL